MKPLLAAALVAITPSLAMTLRWPIPYGGHTVPPEFFTVIAASLLLAAATWKAAGLKAAATAILCGVGLTSILCPWFFNF